MSRLMFGRAAGAALICVASLIDGCAGTATNGGGTSPPSQVTAGLTAAIEVFQVEDTRFIALPEAAVQRGDVILVDPDVVQITTVEELVVNPLPDVTVLGLKNRSGFDAFFRYVVDGEPQAVFVFDQETLVLQYPCLQTIEFLSQEEFEPVTGAFAGSFPASLVELSNPTGFSCGDALILQINADGLIGPRQLISLPP
jgi:hypothetical protein